MADTQLRLEGGRFHAIGSGGWFALRFLAPQSSRTFLSAKDGDECDEQKPQRARDSHAARLWHLHLPAVEPSVETDHALWENHPPKSEAGNED